MKLQSENRELRTNVIEYKEFEVGNSITDLMPHITQIAALRTYSRPVEASLREIFSNACDAHKENKTTTPIEITLLLDKQVKIRDFGPGISPENMTNVYMRIWESTKRDSDEAIGAFGQGRMAPLAINGQFVVESFYNGIKKTYSIAVNQRGVPACAELSSEETNEPNGFSVLIDGSTYEKDIYTLVKCITFASKTPHIIYEELETGELKVVEDYFLDTHYFTVPFTVEGEEFEVDLYLSNPLSLQTCVLDNGGALYHSALKRRNPYDDKFYLSKPLYASFRVEDLDETEKFANNGYANHCTIVLRLKPNTLKLTNGRESYVEEPKLESITKAAEHALKEELTCRYMTWLEGIYQKTKDSYYDCVCQLGRAKQKFVYMSLSKYLLDEYDNPEFTLKRGHYPLSFQEGEFTTVVNCFSHPNFTLENSTTVVFNEASSWTPITSQYHFVYKAPLADYPTGLQSHTCWSGVVKLRYCRDSGVSVPHSGAEMPFDALVKEQYPVVLIDAGSSTISEKKLKELLNVNSLKSPVLFIESYSSNDFEGMLTFLKEKGLLNYCGKYDSEPSQERSTPEFSADRSFKLFKKHLEGTILYDRDGDFLESLALNEKRVFLFDKDGGSTFRVKSGLTLGLKSAKGVAAIFKMPSALARKHLQELGANGYEFKSVWKDYELRLNLAAEAQDKYAVELFVAPNKETLHRLVELGFSNYLPKPSLRALKTERNILDALSTIRAGNDYKHPKVVKAYADYPYKEKCNSPIQLGVVYYKYRQYFDVVLGMVVGKNERLIRMRMELAKTLLKILKEDKAHELLHAAEE